MLSGYVSHSQLQITLSRDVLDAHVMGELKPSYERLILSLVVGGLEPKPQLVFNEEIPCPLSTTPAPAPLEFDDLSTYKILQDVISSVS